MKERFNVLIPICFILVIAYIAFFPSLRYGFLEWDDSGYITSNPLIASLNPGNIKKIWTSFLMSAYQPLAVFSFALEYSLFGLNPAAYHLTNILLHLLNSVLVFWLIFLLSKRYVCAFAATLLFALHPLNVESVVWISERKGLLCAFFFLAALITYIYYLCRKKSSFYFLALFFFFCSLLSKLAAVTLPLILLLLDGSSLLTINPERSRRIDYFYGRKGTRILANKYRINTNFQEKLPFIFLSFIFGLITLKAHFSGMYKGAVSSVGWLEKSQIAASAVYFYLQKLIFPLKLSAIYTLSKETSLYGFFLLLLLVLALLIMSLRRRLSAKLIFAGGFFLICLLPALQFIKVGESPVSDRYTYLGSIGIFYLAGEFFSRWFGSSWRNKVLSAIALMLIAAALFCLTRQRLLVWKDEVNLWTDATNNYPSAIAYNNRGLTWQENGRTDLALADISSALKLDPESFEAYFNRGSIYAKQKEFQKALSDLQKAMTINPRVSMTYDNIGLLYLEQNDFNTAISYFNKAIEVYPKQRLSFYHRGQAYFLMGKYDMAVADYTNAIEIASCYADVYLFRAKVYRLQHKPDLAKRDLSRANQLLGIQADTRKFLF